MKVLAHKENAGWISDQQREGLKFYLSFLVWPFGVMLGALRQWKRPWSRNVFWFFCIFFGLTFIIGEEGGPDSDRYARLFIQYAHSNLNLKELWSSFYSSGSSFVDIASPLITFLVSRLTDNPSILFAVFGLIFGYFYSKNIWYVLNQMNGKITGILLLYIFTFALLNPIWNINGFRMWTAAQIFLYGALPYLLEGKTKSLIWSGVSVLFHFSFLSTLGILLIYILLRNKLNIYLAFFIITSFIKEINLLDVRSILFFLPDIFHTKITNYTNPQYADLISLEQMKLNWYITFSEQGMKWTIYATVIFIYLFGRKKLKEKTEMTSLLCYSLLLFSFANISSLVPGGGRFVFVASTFMFVFFILFLSTFPKIKGLTLVVTFSLPFLLLFCIVSLRGGMDYFGYITLMGNPITAVLSGQVDPLIIGIKRLL